MDQIDRINQRRRQAPRFQGQIGPYVTTCAICKTEFSQIRGRRNSPHFMGKDYCNWCEGPAIREVVLWLSFVEKLATMDCQKPIVWWINHRRYSWCDFKCKCIPCTARIILRRERPKNLVPERIRLWHMPKIQ
jgi:hypothetical protein